MEMWVGRALFDPSLLSGLGSALPRWSRSCLSATLLLLTLKKFQPNPSFCLLHSFSLIREQFESDQFSQPGVFSFSTRVPFPSVSRWDVLLSNCVANCKALCMTVCVNSLFFLSYRMSHMPYLYEDLGGYISSFSSFSISWRISILGISCCCLCCLWIRRWNKASLLLSFSPFLPPTHFSYWAFFYFTWGVLKNSILGEYLSK